MHTDDRGATCVSVSVVPPSAAARVVSALAPHASARRSLGAPAQPAHAADRFAREIVGILTVFVARLRRLMGNSLGGSSSTSYLNSAPKACYAIDSSLIILNVMRGAVQCLKKAPL